MSINQPFWARLAPACFALIFIVSCAPGASARDVCITGELNIENVGAGDCLSGRELEALLDKPVMQGGTGRPADLKMTHPDEFSRQEAVVTCRDYQARLAEDWYAMSGADMAAEGWFKRVCSTIQILANASGARRSYLDDPDTGLSDPAMISARCLPLEAEPSAEEAAALSQEGASLADMEEAGLVDIGLADYDRLELSFGNQDAVYEALARGDFDGDGTEDMLVFMGVHASGGSMRWYEHMGLTRAGPGELLEMVFSQGV